MMRIKKRYSATWLTLSFVAALMIPIIILAITENNPFWMTVSTILLPFGFYTFFAALSSNSGQMVLWGFPFIFFSAFQIAISYLFGNSVVATDMFLNLKTTNPGEAGELLGNIYPAVIAVCAIYLPILALGVIQIRRGKIVKGWLRRKMIVVGSASFIIGCFTLIFGCWGNIRHTLRDELFPVNVAYNLGLAISESNKIDNFEETSQEFLYNATHECLADTREVYVMVIGEAARAANWQLFGYGRETNPLLTKRNEISLFKHVTTQSNTTHKSVPMILSSIHTSEHDELYRRPGIAAIFNEAGFTTYFISNQKPQGAMIDKLANDATHLIYLENAKYDIELVGKMQEVLAQERSQHILIILHTYGSHFSYHQRYPREYAHYMPDDDVAISGKNIEMIRNAYDNSILYTDYVLNEVISTLESMPEVCTGLFYCADHGEDLFDTSKKSFLHASPMVTYYQLHIASFAWLSSTYRHVYAAKAKAASHNTYAPATTYSVFHTVADMASIDSPYINRKASLMSDEFDFQATRYYLDDHNNAVELTKEIGIDDEQLSLFRHAGFHL